MTRFVFERSFLVRRVQHWSLDMADDTDIAHVLNNHIAQLDEDLQTNGELLADEVEIPDDDEMAICHVPEESDLARILPFRTGGMG